MSEINIIKKINEIAKKKKESKLENYSYHKDTSRISASMIKLADSSSLAHVYKRHFSGEEVAETEALSFGRMFHASILEQEVFDDQFVVIPSGIDKRTKAGKELFLETEETGKTPIREKDFKNSQGMVKTLLKELQKNGIDIHKGEFEKPFLIDGSRCKPDVIIVDDDAKRNKKIKKIQIIDLKTCADASPFKFESDAYRLGYHIQAAWYISIIKTFYPHYEIEFIFACVEKKAPFVAQIYKASKQFIKAGDSVCHEQSINIRQAMIADIWPGYFDGIGALELPEWAAYDQLYFNNEGE